MGLKKIEGKVIKNVRNLFRLQNTIDDTVIKNIKIFLDWKKETK